MTGTQKEGIWIVGLITGAIFGVIVSYHWSDYYTTKAHIDAGEEYINAPVVTTTSYRTWHKRGDPLPKPEFKWLPEQLGA